MNTIRLFLWSTQTQKPHFMQPSVYCCSLTYRAVTAHLWETASTVTPVGREA